MGQLEAAHKAKVAAQKEVASNNPYNTNQGSLSTSSSNVSLHRMAPSHRGMTYEIIEHHPPFDDEVPPLPSKWTDVDRYGCLEVTPDGQDIKYRDQVKQAEHEAAAARADCPMPPQCGIYYYEVMIVHKPKEGYVLFSIW